MELSDVIKSLEDVKDQIHNRVTFHKYATIVSKLDDVIAELKEVEYELLSNTYRFSSSKEQPENSSKTQTWKEFCEEENKRRIEDLEKENKRIREEIQKTNNDWYSLVAALFICVANRGGDENEPFT